MKDNKERIARIIKELSDCARGLNKKNSEFIFILRNGIPNAIANLSSFYTVEFSWSLSEKGIGNYEDEASKGIREILRELNDLHCVRSLKREALICFHLLPVRCFNGQMKEIAEIASMMSAKREYFDLDEYTKEIKSRKIVSLEEGRARIKGGDFTKEKAPKAMIGRGIGPTFSIKIHYISDSKCEVEVYMDYLKEEFGNLDSGPSIDTDCIFEGRIFSHKYHDEGILRGGRNNNASIYFYSQDKTVVEALRSVVNKIQKYYLEHMQLQ